jgi:hypothetical protein
MPSTFRGSHTRKDCADVAQLVERRLAKAKVAGSRPVVRSICVPLAQPDRAFDYESKGREFESLRARHFQREVAQLGRVLGLGPRGRRFESCLPDHEPFSWFIRDTKSCGCSSMVELQPSKLAAWVRFPSPAPYITLQKRVCCLRHARFFLISIQKPVELSHFLSRGYNKERANEGRSLQDE